MNAGAIGSRITARWLLMAVAAFFVGAGGGTGMAAQGRGPCASDVEKFCRDVQAGGGRIVRCLKQHEQGLSPACTQHIADVKKQAQEFREACEDDVLRFCGDVRPGGGRIVRCLKQHEPELSPDCRAKMQQKKKEN